MKYCLTWTNISQKLKQADEINAEYINSKKLVDFLKTYSEQKINLLADRYFGTNDVYLLTQISKQYPGLRFAVAIEHFNKGTVRLFKDSKINYYFCERCDNWEFLNYLVKETNVSEINISGPLGFELPIVTKFIQENRPGIKLRAMANKTETLCNLTNPLLSFFIRPEDVQAYEKYIDVLELCDPIQQDNIFEIYKDGFFLGKLPIIINGFSEPIPNIGLFKFGEKRVKCGRECLKGGKCQRCFFIANIAANREPETIQKLLETLKKEKENIDLAKEKNN